MDSTNGRPDWSAEHLDHAVSIARALAPLRREIIILCGPPVPGNGMQPVPDAGETPLAVRPPRLGGSRAVRRPPGSRPHG